MSLPVEKRRQWIKSRREQRKLTKYARLRRQLLRYSILVSLLALGIVAFANVRWRLCQNYDNQGIDISGNFVAKNSQIRQYLKPEIVNCPLFLLNPNELENRVEHLGIIKRAFVRRYALPCPKLKVEVLEEFPWATLYSAASPPRSVGERLNSDLASQKSVLENGAVLSKIGFGLSPHYVVAESGRLILIADFPNVFQPALKIYCDNPSKFNLLPSDVEQWANWIGYISKETHCPVLAIDMRQPHDVQVETGKFTIALGNPDSGLTRRLYRLASVLQVLANQHRELTYINLGLNSNIPIRLAKKLDKNGSEEKVSRL